MELRQLRYLREVVRLGSFHRAAERLFITQPALTKSIRSLEDELGVQLLERGPKGVTTTPFGKILVDCADSVGVDISRAISEIESLNGKSGGIVRVGGMTTVMQWMLPKVVKHLSASGSAIRIVTSVALLDAVVNQLVQGDVDIGLCTLYPWHQSDLIVGERLLKDQVRVVAAASHPLATRRAISLAELSPYRWVLPGSGDAWRQRLGELYRQSGLQDPDVAVEVGSAALMVRLVEDTTMLSLLPGKLLDADEIFRGLRPLDFEPHWPEFEVYLAYRKKGIVLPSTRAFIDALKAIFPDRKLSV